MIREAIWADHSAIAQISEKDLGYPCDPALVAQRLSHLDKDRECVYVAVQDNAVVGFIHIEKYTLLYHQAMANILGIAVSSAYRRRGIGRALLNAAEAWAKDRGLSAMRLNSGAARKDAHLFYRSAGYTDEKAQIRLIKRF